MEKIAEVPVVGGVKSDLFKDVSDLATALGIVKEGDAFRVIPSGLLMQLMAKVLGQFEQNVRQFLDATFVKKEAVPATTLAQPPIDTVTVPNT